MTPRPAPPLPEGITRFDFPTRIVFGDGARAELAAELARLGVARPLVVTDEGLVASGLVSGVLGNLAGAVIFAGIRPGPTDADVLDGLAAYRRSGCDGLIGLGGGSPIAAAKALRLLATPGDRLADILRPGGSRPPETPGESPPLVAVPTTAGSGGEAGCGATIRRAAGEPRAILWGPELLPSVALCDPGLTLEMPPAMTAATGMDAFARGLEAYLATPLHPICDGIALEGLRHVSGGLEAAVRDGSDRRARRSMALGALLCGIGAHKGLGVAHALSQALDGPGWAHRGTLNAILLPHALRFNREAAGARMADLASQLGLGRGGDAAGHLAILAELVLAKLPLPRRLGDVPGLDHARLAEAAALALTDPAIATNPRPCTRADLEGILERAW